MNMQEFWDKLAEEGTWASYYEGQTGMRTYNFFTRREAVMKLLERAGKFERMLDVGCGTGDYAPLAEAHEAQFFGIDFAHEMIKQAVDRVGGQGERNLFVTGSGEHLPYADDSFDLVIAMGYIEYFVDPNVPLAEIQRVLRPGGTLVMQSFKWNVFSNFRRLVWTPMKSLIKPANDNGLPSNWVNRRYSRGGLNGILAPWGWRNVGGLYNNFHVFPYKLRARYSRRYIQLSEMINRTCPNLFGWLAANYVGHYKLDEKRRPASAG